MIRQCDGEWSCDVNIIPEEPLQPAVVGTSPATTMVYIDTIKDGRVYGLFQNVFDCFSCEFKGLTQFLLNMDTAMDIIQYPQAFMRHRTWDDKKRCNIKSCDQDRQWTVPPDHKRGLPDISALNRSRGKVTTFCIQVITRRNASWQGRVIWLSFKQNRREAYFRSALELLSLMQLALEQECGVQNVS